MKHHRCISRRPAVATSALGAKLEFKASLSDSVATGAATLIQSFTSMVTTLLLNAFTWNVSTVATVYPGVRLEA